MNRRQEERLSDLGKAFYEAIGDIINMGGNDIQENRYLDCDDRNEGSVRGERNEGSVRGEELVLTPVIDMNDRLAQYDVNIKHVHNGFIVNVGCQTFVFESFDKLAKYMKMYYEDPNGTHKKHSKGELLSK